MATASHREWVPKAGDSPRKSYFVVITNPMHLSPSMSDDIARVILASNNAEQLQKDESRERGCQAQSYERGFVPSEYA